MVAAEKGCSSSNKLYLNSNLQAFRWYSNIQPISQTGLTWWKNTDMIKKTGSHQHQNFTAKSGVELCSEKHNIGVLDCLKFFILHRLYKLILLQVMLIMLFQQINQQGDQNHLQFIKSGNSWIFIFWQILFKSLKLFRIELWTST